MGSQSRIALVDDDDAVREATAALVRRDGYDVVPFQNGDDFLNHRPTGVFDVVLLDIRMPGSSGIDVLRALDRRNDRVPAIVLTGHGDIAIAVEAMKLGAIDFLEKPYRPDHLRQAIRSALAGSAGSTSQGNGSGQLKEALAALTPRQREVLGGIAAGKPNKIIAYELGLSPRTVEACRARLFDRLGVRSTAEAVRAAISGGLI